MASFSRSADIGTPTLTEVYSVGVSFVFPIVLPLLRNPPWRPPDIQASCLLRLAWLGQFFRLWFWWPGPFWVLVSSTVRRSSIGIRFSQDYSGTLGCWEEVKGHLVTSYKRCTRSAWLSPVSVDLDHRVWGCVVRCLLKRYSLSSPSPSPLQRALFGRGL